MSALTSEVDWMVAPLTIAVIRRKLDGRMKMLASLLIIELLTQLTLGVLTILLKKPADIASFHVAVGALTLVTCWTLTVCVARVSSSSMLCVNRSVERRDAPEIPVGVLTA